MCQSVAFTGVVSYYSSTSCTFNAAVFVPIP